MVGPMNSERPDHHLTAVASISGRPLGNATANIERADLASANIGKGDHAFVLRLEPPLPPGELDKVNVLAFRGEDIAVMPLRRLPRENAAEMPFRIRLPTPTLQCDPSQYPVFILGTTRSGTSAVLRGLLATGRYAGAGEGHYLELLGDFLSTLDNYYDAHREALLPGVGTVLKDLSIDTVRDKIERIFIDIASRMFPNRYWVDKTPTIGMIDLAPTFLTMWPNARFIYMKRRGIENIASKGRKFNSEFTNRCVEWACAMNRWIEIRDNLEESAIEIDQIDLAMDPTSYANLIAKHIGLPLNNLLALTEMLVHNRPEATTDEFPLVLDFHEISWDRDSKTEFQRICGPTMERYGYTYDRRYRKLKPLQL